MSKVECCGREAQVVRDSARPESAWAFRSAQPVELDVKDERRDREADAFRDLARPESARADSGLRS